MRVQRRDGAAVPRAVMGVVPFVRAALLAVTLATLLAALLAGCAGGGGGGGGGGGASDSSTGGSSQTSGDTETFEDPDPEPTTPETSDESSSDDNPAISVARLPVGGDSDDDPSDTRLQCAHVSWIASDDGQIPRGTGVEITGVLFDPEAFQAVGDGCGSERPSCLHHVFRSSALQCDVAVRATGDVAQDANPSLGFAGLVFCPDNSSDSCRRFVAALADEQQLSVSLNVPQPPSETTGSTDTTQTPETTNGGEPTDTSAVTSTGTATDTATTDGG
jgi:hypothetical protein